MGRLGPALLLAISTYLVLALLFGPRGVVAHRHRSQYRLALERNVERLTERRDELAQRIARLQEDPQAIKTAVREQQVLAPGEHLIRLQNSTGDSLLPRGALRGSISPGSVLRRQAKFPDYSPVFRGVAASAGLAAYVFALGLQKPGAPAGQRRNGPSRAEQRPGKREQGRTRSAARSRSHAFEA